MSEHVSDDRPAAVEEHNKLTTPELTTMVFVDDDPDVLQTIRDLTHRFCDTWDAHFVDGGHAALALIEELGHVDIVVTDMYMPDMDGAELLSALQERSPHTARIILAGKSEREALLRAVGPAHQYLSKPVDIDELAQVVEHARTASLRELCDPIRSLIGQADRLPSPPGIFQQLVDLLAAPDWTVDDVADLISDDVALTAEILKLVNSAFFGYFGDVNSVSRAVSLLGVDLIRTVVLGSKLFEPDEALESWLDLELLDWRSKSVADGARSLAIRDNASAETTATAYLAGMVCEVGLLVMARVPDVDAGTAASCNVDVDLVAERATFGGNRFEVGSQLLRLWGFSTPVVDAIDQLCTDQLCTDQLCTDQLCTTGTPDLHGLAWYLFAARHLVLDAGLDPQSLAAPEGSVAEVDDALAELLQTSLNTSLNTSLAPAR